jgi:hypothetical protein
MQHERDQLSLKEIRADASRFWSGSEMEEMESLALSPEFLFEVIVRLSPACRAAVIRACKGEMRPTGFH